MSATVVAAPPTFGSVALAVGAVLIASLVAAIGAYRAWRTRNWLNHALTAGGLLVVVGIAGQRNAVPGAAIGPWDAAITVPVTGTTLTPVCVAGLILTLLGVALVLLLERVDVEGEGRRVVAHRPLEDDDAI